MMKSDAESISRPVHGRGGDIESLSDAQVERYSRYAVLEGVGAAGLEKLARSRILVAGIGGLGSPAALYCCAAGIGTVAIVDCDIVSESNLGRQVLYSSADIGKPKTEAAAERLRALNPHVDVRAHQLCLTPDTIDATVRGFDFVIDGTDSFDAKFLINDACVRAGVAFSHAGVLRYEGQTMTVVPGKSACYRCVFPSAPAESAVPTCSFAGILGPVAGIVGSIQAAECIKFLCGVGTLLTNRLFILDARTMEPRVAEVRRNPKCRACG